MVRCVLSLTTLPDRYTSLLKNLKSLSQQTVKPDAIYLCLPYIAKRSGKSYPPLSMEMNELCTVVRTEVDYGPICKLYGALKMEQDPETVIITVDDDVTYPTNLVEKMLQKHALKPNAAITGCGVLINDGYNMSINTNFEGLMFMNGFLCGFPYYNGERKVDIVQGISGVLYKRGFFPNNLNDLLQYTEDEDIFRSDDILISSWLCHQRIKRYTFKDMPRVTITLADDAALSSDLRKMLQTFKRTVKKCQDLKLLTHLEEASMATSPTVRTPFWMMMIIVIIVVIYIVIRYLKEMTF